MKKLIAIMLLTALAACSEAPSKTDIYRQGDDNFAATNKALSPDHPAPYYEICADCVDPHPGDPDGMVRSDPLPPPANL